MYEYFSMILWLCILVSEDQSSIEWNWISRVLKTKIVINPLLNILLSDIIPIFLAIVSTVLALYMNGYVGVLDLENLDIQEVQVIKLKGKSIKKCLTNISSLEKQYESVHHKTSQ